MTAAVRMSTAALLLLALLASSCGGASSTDTADSGEPEPEADLAETIDEPTAETEPTPEPPAQAAEPVSTATPVPTPSPTPSPGPDADADGTPDALDDDDDNDGVPDTDDDFPFDPSRREILASQFPLVDGVVQLPDLPSVEALRWLQDQVLTGGTTVDEVLANFTPNFLSFFQPQQVVDFLATLGDADDGRWIAPVDARAVSQWWLWVAMGDPDNLAGGINLVQIEVDPNTGLIDLFGARGANPGLLVWSDPQDQSLSIAEAVEQLGTKGPDVSVVVAEIIGDECSVIAGHNEAIPGAIGSLFKTWVVGAIASEIEAGDISPDDTVTFVPGDYITAGARSTGKFTSEFELTVQQASNLMINISDNGATDVMMDFVGRDATTEWVFASGHADAERFTPMLNASEFFHLWGNVSQGEAAAYLAGDAAFQREFADTRLAPLRAYNQGVQRNFAAHVESWSASPLDACNNFAALRTRFIAGTEAGDFVDEVMGAEALLFGLRNEWDRVWYKGGALPGDSPDSAIARSDALLVESNDGKVYMLVGIYNDADDSTVGIPNKPFGSERQSLYARIMQHLVDGTGQ